MVCWGLNGGPNTAAMDDRRWKQLSLAHDASICGIAADTSAVRCVRGIETPANVPYTSPWPFFYLTHGPEDISLSSQACGVRANGGQAQAHCNGFGIDNPTMSGNWRRLEAGVNHICGLKDNGSIECRGGTIDGQSSGAPTSSEKFRTLSVGWNHACAIRSDGTLKCWGNSANGKTDAPAGTFLQVAAGNVSTCAIRSNGSRVCWGLDVTGQAPQFTLLPAVLADGQVDVAHAGATFQMHEDSPNVLGAHAFAVVDGALPAGLTLDGATGAFAGTPTEGGTFTFTVEAEDENGFTASREYTLTIISDTTPPVISYTLNGVAAPGAPDGNDNNDWYVSNVDVVWMVEDPESLIASESGCTPSTLTGDAIGATATCSAINGVGLETEVTTVLVNIDVTKPTVEVSQSPATPNGSNDWYTSEVTVSFVCEDATSGIDSCPASQTLSSDGASISSTAQTAMDSAGNVSDASNVVTVKIDKTAPTIIAAAIGTADGNNGWYRSDVTVQFTCNDALSGIDTCPANQTLSSDGSAVSSTAQTVSDNAGNVSESSNVVTVKIDKTAPTIIAAATSAADGNNGWYRSNVTVQFICNDALSGIDTCPANQTLSSDGASVSSTARTVFDNAGNVSASSNEVSVKIDKTAPTITPILPDPILRGHSYAANPNASDATSGIASSSCGALDTSTLGHKSTTCTATDKAGNTNTVMLNYMVNTTCVNDGYKSTQLTWCTNICENGLTGATLDSWIHRWSGRYRELPYCQLEPVQHPQ